MRAPFVSSDDFELFIRKKNWFSRFLSSIETGDRAFDARFRVTSNDAAKAKRVLGSPSSIHKEFRMGAATRQLFVDNDWLRLRVVQPMPWRDYRFVTGVRQVEYLRRKYVPARDQEVIAG